MPGAGTWARGVPEKGRLGYVKYALVVLPSPTNLSTKVRLRLAPPVPAPGHRGTTGSQKTRLGYVTQVTQFMNDITLNDS